jgi:DNA processing protein
MPRRIAGLSTVTGLTIAVVGTGLDSDLPGGTSPTLSRDRGLRRHHLRVSSRVLLRFPRTFPIVTGILSGLCFGVLIVEAAEHSGSLITARMAAEQGRDVYAVPGNITSQTSFGPNYLIKDGAKLIQCARDVLEELPNDPPGALTYTNSADDPSPAVQTEYRLGYPHRGRTFRHRTPLDRCPSPHRSAPSGQSDSLRPTMMNALLGLEMKDRIITASGQEFFATTLSSI